MTTGRYGCVGPEDCRTGIGFGYICKSRRSAAQDKYTLLQTETGKIASYSEAILQASTGDYHSACP